MTSSLKNKLEDTVDKVAGAGSANRIEGKSKELLGRVLEELGEWLEEPETMRRGEEKQLEGKLQQLVGEDQQKTDSVAELAKDRVEDVIDDAKAAAADTARRLKELF